MLKLNLVPFEELENKRWFMPDLLLLLLLCGGSGLVLYWYIDRVKESIAEVRLQSSEMEQRIAELAPHIQRFAMLRQEVEDLQIQLASLERVTTAKIPRYRPAIILEKLQRLKPAGLWFRSVTEQTATSTLTISGQSYDKLQVAQFIAGLAAREKSPQEQEGGGDAIRFVKVNLQQLNEQPPVKEAGKEGGRGIVNYEISVGYQESPNQKGTYVSAHDQLL